MKTGVYNPLGERSIWSYGDVKTETDMEEYQKHVASLRTAQAIIGEMHDAALADRDEDTANTIDRVFLLLEAEIKRFTEGETQAVLESLFNMGAMLNEKDH